MAGPPYEDIAFRIVNREWEFSHKRYVDPLTESPAVPLIIHLYSGFRSSFDRGCLSLWFNFRRNVSVFWTYFMSKFLTSSRSSTGNNHALSSGVRGILYDRSHYVFRHLVMFVHNGMSLYWLKSDTFVAGNKVACS